MTERPKRQTGGPERLSAAVRARPGLRAQLIWQAGQNSENEAFERVLATLYGAELILGSGLNVPEALTWTQKTLKFRGHEAEPCPAGGEDLPDHDPLWARLGVTRVRHYSPSDPLHAQVLTGMLLAWGLERNEALVQSAVQYAQANRGFSFTAAFEGRLRPWERPLPRDQPVLEGQDTLIDFEPGWIENLHGARHETFDTTYAAVFRQGSEERLRVGVYDWPLRGNGQRLAFNYYLDEMQRARKFQRQWAERDLILDGRTRLTFDGQALGRLLSRQQEAGGPA